MGGSSDAADAWARLPAQARAEQIVDVLLSSGVKSVHQLGASPRAKGIHVYLGAAGRVTVAADRVPLEAARRALLDCGYLLEEFSPVAFSVAAEDALSTDERVKAGVDRAVAQLRAEAARDRRAEASAPSAAITFDIVYERPGPDAGGRSA